MKSNSSIDTVPSSGEMTLLQLPDLVRHRILDNLKLKDVLNFRKVCRETNNAWVMSYNNFKSRLKLQRINLVNTEQYEAFSKCDVALPLASFGVEFDPSTLSEAHQNFATKYGSRIEDLMVEYISFCSTDEEYAFYSALTSLKSLTLINVDDGVTAHERKCHNSEVICLKCTDGNKFHYGPYRFPQTVGKTLERMKIYNMNYTYYIYDILPFLERIEHLEVDSLENIHPNHNVPSSQEMLCEQMKKIACHVAQRKQCPYLRNIQLKLRCPIFDRYSILCFDNLENDTNTKSILLDFLHCIYSGYIKIHRMMNANFYEVLSRNYLILRKKRTVYTNLQTLDEMVSNVSVLSGISPSLLMTQMPKLRSLAFCFASPRSRSIDDQDDLSHYLTKPIKSITSSLKSLDWPKLTGIIGHLEKTDDPHLIQGAYEVMNDLLLTPYKRKFVNSLFFRLRTPTRLTPTHFTRSFPNLRYLWLEDVSFTSTDFSNLFFLLGTETKIQTLKLGTSVTFDDTTFFGPLVPVCGQIPYFRTMKHLKEFLLTSRAGAIADNRVMIHEISNKVFEELICKMPLSSFKIMATLNQVSEGGVRSLLNQELGQTIQTFSVTIRQAELDSCPESFETPSGKKVAVSIDDKTHSVKFHTEDVK